MDLPGWLDLARRRGVLSRLPNRLVAAMIEGGRLSSHSAGALVPRHDAGPLGLVCISGSFRVFLPGPEGRQVTLRYLRPGDIVDAFEAVQPALARRVQAVDGGELLHLDMRRLQLLAEREVELAYQLLLESTRALRLVHRSYCIRAFGSVRLRVASALLDRASLRGEPRDGALVPGSQTDLADAVGTVREVAAFALAALRRDGIIDVRRRAIVILDVGRLLNEAGGAVGWGR